jgi:hypothetical protein
VLVLLQLPGGRWANRQDKTPCHGCRKPNPDSFANAIQSHSFTVSWTVPCRIPRPGPMLSALCSLLLLLSYALWRSALVSSGAEAGQCEPPISQCTPLSALGQCSGSPAAKNTHTPNRVEKEILRDPGLGLGRYCFEGYNANEVTAILALPAWHAPHSHSPIRCSRCRLHIISRLPLRCE